MPQTVQIVTPLPENECKCVNWLAHWEKFSTEPLPVYCSVLSCYNDPDIGAFVQKTNADKKNIYVIPLCEPDSKRVGENISVSDGQKFVLADVTKTCRA